jgi:hypothetical protein
VTTYTNTYDPTNASQVAFLAALQSGENASGNPELGYGGANLANAPTTANGFPIWSGVATSGGTTHAAGLYQFQPATWNSVANQLGLNFQNPADQNEAAWDLASANYAQANGGASLQSALDSGQYAQVASTLQPTWTSLTANRLSTAASAVSAGTTSAAGALGSAIAALSGGNAVTGAIAGAVGAGAVGLTSFQTDIVNMFARGGVMILAVIVIAFGLFFLTDHASGGAVSKTAKAALV